MAETLGACPLLQMHQSDQSPYPSRAINWELISQQYDQMVKYATALRLGVVFR